MLDDTRTIEREAELVQSPRAAGVSRRNRAKARQNKPAAEKVDALPAREIILRLIDLIKQV